MSTWQSRSDTISIAQTSIQKNDDNSINTNHHHHYLIHHQAFEIKQVWK